MRYNYLTKLLLGVTAVVLITACTTNEDRAENAIRSILKDPSSLIIKNITHRIWKDSSGVEHTMICGLYNAKNGFGGYAGWETFAYDTNANVTFFDPEMPKKSDYSVLDITDWDGLTKARNEWVESAKRYHSMCHS